MNKPVENDRTNVRAYDVPPLTSILLMLLVSALPVTIFLVDSLPIAFVLFVLCAGLQIFTYLLLRNHLIFLCAIPAYCLIYLCTSSPLFSLAVLPIGALSIGCAIAIEREKAKTTSVIWGAVALGACFCVLSAIILYLRYDRLSLSLVRQVGSQWFEQLRTQMTQLSQSMQQIWTAQTGDTIDATVDAQLIKTTVDYLKRIALGVGIDLLLLCAYLAVSISRLCARLLHCPDIFPNASFPLTLSSGSAIVYCASYFVLLFVASSVARIVAFNLIIILTPGLFITGWMQLAAVLHNARYARSRIFLLLLLAFLLLYQLMLFINCVVLFGLWAAAKRLGENKKNT